MDFLAGSIPWISAAFLNALQDTQTGVINGIVSLKSVVVDGVGGAVSATTAGWVSALGAKINQAIGTSTASQGDLYQEFVPFATCVIDGGTAPGTPPSIIYQANVLNVTRVLAGAGHYLVQIRANPTKFAALPNGTAVKPCVLITPINTNQSFTYTATKQSGGLSIEVIMAADTSFAMVVFP